MEKGDVTKSRFQLATECQAKLFYTGESEYTTRTSIGLSPGKRAI